MQALQAPYLVLLYSICATASTVLLYSTCATATTQSPSPHLVQRLCECLRELCVLL